MKIEVAKSPIPAAQQLLDHIRALDTTVPAWCEEHGLDRIRIQRIVNGERWRRITADMAFAIERATKGKVKAAWFQSSTAVPVSSAAA